MKDYEETDYEIPKNEAVCFEEDCTCRYVSATESNKMLITYCKNRELGSHLWLHSKKLQWASICPISQEEHETSMIIGEPLMEKVSFSERNLH